MIRAGFVGTGSFARVHADILKKLGVQVAACYSLTPEKAAAFGQAYGAKVFADPLAKRTENYPEGDARTSMPEFSSRDSAQTSGS